MNTIYILGKKGFRHALSKQLGRTARTCLPGELLDFDDDLECQLYWIPENMNLHEFKRKIGSFIVLKYRMTFYGSVDEYLLKSKERIKKKIQSHEPNEDKSLQEYLRIVKGGRKLSKK